MPKCITYVDANVLVSAFRGKDDVSNEALEVLDDEEREFVISDILVLETLPKPKFHKFEDEAKFMEAFFEGATRKVGSSPEITESAISLACQYNLGPRDALHVAAAVREKVDEFVTTEKNTKPMFQVQGLKLTSLS
jgi:hypothetical protein